MIKKQKQTILIIFFVNVGLKFGANIPASKTNYKRYLDFNNSVLPDFEINNLKLRISHLKETRVQGMMKLVLIT